MVRCLCLIAALFMLTANGIAKTHAAVNGRIAANRITTAFDETSNEYFNSFIVQEANQQVLLSWEAAEQSGVSYYLIERRINGEDFLAIGGINVSRRRQAEANLRFTDQMKRRKDGLYVYRVKQVMKNGSINYSPELSLVRLSPASIHVYNHPDPAYLNLEFGQQSPLPYQVMLMDLAGNVKFIRNVQSGEMPFGRFELPVGNLADGMYLLRIEDATQIWVQRVLIR